MHSGKIRGKSRRETTYKARKGIGKDDMKIL